MPIFKTFQHTPAHWAAALLLLAAGQASIAWAQQGPPPGGPSTEALAACQKLSAGAACSFSGQRGNESGTCWAPEGKPLACKPANGPANGMPPAKPQ